MAKKHRKESLDALFREKVLLEMLKIAGVGMWTYSTETGRLRYIGFADTIGTTNCSMSIQRII